MLHGTFAAFVKDVWTEELTEPVTVYNFEVAVAHTYFVSKRNILVHNLCKNDIYNSVKNSPKYNLDFKPTGKTTYRKINTKSD